MDVFNQPKPKSKPRPKDKSKKDYVIGKMHVKSQVLDPVELGAAGNPFFNKRLKSRADKRHAKKVLRKIQRTSDPIELRKTLTRLGNRKSMPHIKVKDFTKEPLKPDAAIHMLRNVTGTHKKSQKVLLNYIPNEKFQKIMSERKQKPKTSCKTSRHKRKHGLAVPKKLRSEPIAVSIKHRTMNARSSR